MTSSGFPGLSCCLNNQKALYSRGSRIPCMRRSQETQHSRVRLEFGVSPPPPGRKRLCQSRRRGFVFTRRPSRPMGCAHAGDVAGNLDLCLVFWRNPAVGGNRKSAISKPLRIACDKQPKEGRRDRTAGGQRGAFLSHRCRRPVASFRTHTHTP